MGFNTLFKIIASVAIVCCSYFPLIVHAHVKWFAPYDTTEAPLAISSLLLDPMFFWVMAISAVFIFAMSFVDAYTQDLNRMINVSRYRLLKALPDNFAYLSLRKTLIVFFCCVWAIGGVVLTPELKHNSLVVAGIQVLIIASLMTHRTSKFAGLGIFLLWLYGVKQYGLFHLSDYMIFLGIAVFMLIGSSNQQQKPSALAFLILYIGISFTLQWASVEKWIYAHWTYPVLQEREYLTFGMDKELFMIMAGFVEFALAFLLIAIAGSGFVVTTVSLSLVFILAIIDFGKIDAIGHLAIIVCLLLMALKGPSRINLFFANMDPDPARNAIKVTGCYLLSLTFFIAIYYGMFFFVNVVL